MKRILTLSLVEFLVDVVISVILVGLLQLFIPLDAYENILLGMLLVIALVIMRTGFTVFQIHEILSQIQKYQNKVEKFSTRLREILDGLRVVASKYSSDDNTLFLDWYEDKLASLSNHIRNTIENESFYFDASLIQEIDKIYDKVFQGRDIDYYWATSSCKGIGWFLTTSGSAFLKIIDGKFRTNKLMSLRRLLIYDSDDELQDYKTRLCFFLHQQSNYEYKIITRSDFESILNGFEDRTLVQDFGIYGEHFVWETVSDDRITIQHGYICVNDIRLKKYRQLYFKLWEAGIDYKVQDEKFKEYIGFRMSEFRTLVFLNSPQMESTYKL